MTKPILWSDEKNQLLKDARGFGFEDIVAAIETGHILADLPNPSKGFPHQRMFVVELNGYAVGVPYVEDEEKIFLKTAYRNRRLNKMYLKE